MEEHNLNYYSLILQNDYVRLMQTLQTSDKHICQNFTLM